MSSRKPKFDTSSRETRGEHIYGSKYPYFDFEETRTASFLNPFKRLFAPINPFAYKQVSDDFSIGFGPMDKSTSYSEQVYPNSVGWARFGYPHYNPVEDINAKEPNWITEGIVQAANGRHRIAFVKDRLPRICIRTKKAFERCKMLNGAEKCQEEVKDLMELCPNFALQKMKEQKRFERKAGAIQNQQYKDAMLVPEYNQGRTMADISGKTHVHGTRQYLRPDTMWADERYANVTQNDINEAKERYNARQSSQSDDHHGEHHGEHNHDYAFVGKEKKLYY